MRRASASVPDLFSALAAPVQVRVPARAAVAEPVSPPRDAVCVPPETASRGGETDPLAAHTAAHRLLEFAHQTAAELQQRLQRGPPSPNVHAARLAAHAAVQIGGAAIALGQALLLNGAEAHDAFLPADDQD